MKSYSKVFHEQRTRSIPKITPKRAAALGAGAALVLDKKARPHRAPGGGIQGSFTPFGAALGFAIGTKVIQKRNAKKKRTR